MLACTRRTATCRRRHTQKLYWPFAGCYRHLAAHAGRLAGLGTRSNAAGFVRSHLSNEHRLGTNLARCDLDGNQFIWVALRHPTRNWSSINQPYFRDTVVPTLQQARKRALKLPQPV
jgi:hypothetical protein